MSGTGAAFGQPGLFHTPIHGPISISEAHLDGAGRTVVNVQIGLDDQERPAELVLTRPWLRALEEAFLAAEARMAMFTGEHRRWTSATSMAPGSRGRTA